MNGYQWLGAVLMSLPFVALYIFAAVELGWRVATGIYLAVAFMVALIGLASFLLVGVLP